MFRKFRFLFVFLFCISLFICFSINSYAAEKSVDTSYIDYVEQQSNLSAVDDYTDRVLIVEYDDDNNIQSYFLLYAKSEYVSFNHSNSALATRNQAYLYKLNSDFSVNRSYDRSIANLVFTPTRMIIYSDFDILDREGNVFYSTKNNIHYNGDNSYNSLYNIFTNYFDNLANSVIEFFSIVFFSFVIFFITYLVLKNMFSLINWR